MRADVENESGFRPEGIQLQSAKGEDDMNMRRISLVLVLALVLSCTAEAASGEEKEALWPPPPPMGLSGICSGSQDLYVITAGKILRYRLSDWKLLDEVELPDLPPPPSSPPEKTKSDKSAPRPPMGIPHGLWTQGGFLYALAGPMVYRYSTPDLTLQNALELPRPDTHR